jgi:hypothetical protein
VGAAAGNYQIAATQPDMGLKGASTFIESGSVVKGGGDALSTQQPPRGERLWVAVAVGRGSRRYAVYRPVDTSGKAELVGRDTHLRSFQHRNTKPACYPPKRKHGDHAPHDDEQQICTQQ